MRRIVLWGVIAVFGIPVIATAEELRFAPAPVFEFRPGGIIQMTGPGGVIELTGPGTVTQTSEAKDSKFWIGLSCAPLDGALRSQLGLEAGGGLVIRQIADNSSAKDAGLLVHDVITEIVLGGEKHKPSDVIQLTALVQQAEGKPMMFTLLRGGKPVSVAVTPKERNFFDNSLPNDPAAGPFRVTKDLHPFRMAGPVMAFGAPPMNLPDDLTVVITKSGSQPVEITVRQKDRGEWKLREKEPAVQPNNISEAVVSVMGHLSRLVGHVNVKDGEQVFTLESGAHVNFGFAPGSTPPRERADVRYRSLPNAPVAARVQAIPTMSILQQRLDEIQKQQEQMTKALDELRQAVQKTQPRN